MAATTTIISDLNFKPLVHQCLQELPRDPKACNDMAAWDVSRVTDGSVLFWEELDNANHDWKMSNGAAYFNVDISGWQTTSFTDMRSMFHGASAFNQPIGLWDVSNVTNMSRLFQGAKAFNQSLQKWQTERVQNMSHMFRYTGQFQHDNLPLDWNVTQVQHFEYMFHDSGFNGIIGQWDVSGARDVVSMFDGAARFNQPLQHWNVSGTKSLLRMFHNARSFNQDLSDWDITGKTDLTDMFFGAVKFGQNLCWDIDTNNSSNVKMERILEGAKPQANIDNNVAQCRKQKMHDEGHPWLAVENIDKHSWPIVLFGVILLLLPLLSILFLCCCQWRHCRKNQKINIKRTSNKKRIGRKRRTAPNTNIAVEEEEVFFGETDGEIQQHEAEYRRQQRQQLFIWGIPEGEISFEVEEEDQSEQEEEGENSLPEKEQPSLFGSSFFVTQSLSLLSSPSTPVAAATKDVSLEEECTIEGVSLQALNKGQDEGILC